ncbi:interleukin-12 subunit alpha-like [Rhineura floridana]|uniref:interleukin-12 subunit alpha-like n=1 Tax=Rhineura floridana TaxID=261503 RepID=UPI002AC88741|nr:interleukin-12 subunit alpha-like [Rhineura floridana]
MHKSSAAAAATCASPRRRCPGVGAVSLGSWLLVSVLCLSLPSSLLAYHTHTSEPATKGLSANLSDCLIISTHLMDAADVALHQLQNHFNCTVEYNVPANPMNEKKIMKACMGGYSLKFELCPSGENGSVDQTLCMDTIYTILKHYMVEIKNFSSPDLFGAVSHMMQALKANQKITEQPPSSPEHPLSKTFEMEMKQCKILLTLQQLAQTINRILYYQKSLEI